MISLAERAAQRRTERVETILKKRYQQAPASNTNTDSFLSSSITWKNNEQLLINRLHNLNEDDFYPIWTDAIAKYKKEIQLGPLTLRARTGRLQWGLKKMVDFFEYIEIEEATAHQESVKPDGAKPKRSTSTSGQERIFPQQQKLGRLL